MEFDDEFLPVLARSFLPFCAWCGLKGEFECYLYDFPYDGGIRYYCEACDFTQGGAGPKRDKEAVSPITGWTVYFHKGDCVVEKTHAFKMLKIPKGKEYGERG